MNAADLVISFAKALILFLAVLNIVPIMVWAERRGAALIQDRPGPNRVGPLGLFQPIADFVKFLWKEDPVPTQVNHFLYNLSPFLTLLPASLVIAVVPFGDHIELFGRQINLQIADIDLGLLYFLAIGSLGIYGILFGGWASNNKFSLLGAMRSSSQMISYEIPLALAAAGAVVVFGTANLRTMVLAQEGSFFGFPRWGVLYQPLGFLIFFLSAFAETNRMPFDLPETEAELVAGYHTEYGSMKFATFFMAEYMNLTSISAIMVAMFFGGWHLPWITDAFLLGLLHGHTNWLALLQIAVFFAKVTVFLVIFIWVRWTVPRFRFDQLMRVAWRGLIPLALLNLVVTALVLCFLEAP